MINRCLMVFIVLVFSSSVFAQQVTIIKQRLLVDKKESPLVHTTSKSGNVKVQLISKGEQKAPRRKKITITKTYTNGKKKYVQRKVVSSKKYKKKKVIKTKKKKKVVAKKKAVAKKKTAAKSKKTLISNMKTCAIYNPPDRKYSSVVVEATSDKNRKISKNKRCRTYRKTKKNGKSMLVIEIEENQI